MHKFLITETDLNINQFKDMISSVAIMTRIDVREKGFATCRGTRSSAPKSSKQPPKTREPEQLRSWLVICGSGNVQDYDVADFSAIQPAGLLLYQLALNITTSNATFIRFSYI